MLFWIYDVQQTSLEIWWVARFNGPCWLLRQVIKTVHPMCCVPSSVDTLSGLLLGWYARFFLFSAHRVCHPLLSTEQSVTTEAASVQPYIRTPSLPTSRGRL